MSLFLCEQQVARLGNLKGREEKPIEEQCVLLLGKASHAVSLSEGPGTRNLELVQLSIWQLNPLLSEELKL